MSAITKAWLFIVAYSVLSGVTFGVSLFGRGLDTVAAFMLMLGSFVLATTLACWVHENEDAT